MILALILLTHLVTTEWLFLHAPIQYQPPMGEPVSTTQPPHSLVVTGPLREPEAWELPISRLSNDTFAPAAVVIPAPCDSTTDYNADSCPACELYPYQATGRTLLVTAQDIDGIPQEAFIYAYPVTACGCNLYEQHSIGNFAPPPCDSAGCYTWVDSTFVPFIKTRNALNGIPAVFTDLAPMPYFVTALLTRSAPIPMGPYPDIPTYPQTSGSYTQDDRFAGRIISGSNPASAPESIVNESLGMTAATGWPASQPPRPYSLVFIPVSGLAIFEAGGPDTLSLVLRFVNTIVDPVRDRLVFSEVGGPP